MSQWESGPQEIGVIHFTFFHGQIGNAWFVAASFAVINSLSNMPPKIQSEQVHDVCMCTTTDEPCTFQRRP